MKRTQRDKLIDGLTALGWSPTSKDTKRYRVFSKNGEFAYVGKAGALRLGRTASDSHACSDRFRALVIEAGESR